MKTSRSWGAFSYANSPNVGDEIQTLAALQYLPQLDFFLDRDHLQELKGDSPISCLFNGWFKHGEGNWPPPSFVDPLFVSFFVNPPVASTLVNPTLKGFYERHAPIGCRSLSTVQLFDKIGIEAYFSGCLTLTLARPSVERGTDILIAEPDSELLAKLVPAEIREKAARQSQLYVPENEAPMSRRILRKVLRPFVPSASLPSVNPTLSAHERNLRKIKRAKERLMTFAKAKLVITGRLHVALPCLAIGTPVLFLYDGYQSEVRFSGLHPLLRAYSSEDRIDFDWENPEPNKKLHLPLVSALEKKCLDWVSHRTGSPAVKKPWWEIDLASASVLERQEASADLLHHQPSAKRSAR